MTILYLSPFFLALGLSLLCTGMCIWISRHVSFPKRRTEKRHIHPQNVSRLGGVAIIAAFLVTVFLDPHLVISSQLWGIVVASALILAVGLLDDLREIDWRTQLFFHIAVGAIIFIMGIRVEYITNPFGGLLFLTIGTSLLPGILFVIGWIVLMMNVMNWSDGVDGVSGSIATIGALTIFGLTLSPEVNQPPVGIIAMAFAGAVLGFLLFNFYPARIVAGTSGSLFMGFMLGALAIFAGAKIATALLIMAIPITDALWVLWERFRSGESLTAPDQRHLHYRLLALGWSQRQVAVFLASFTTLIGAVALNTRTIGKAITLILVGIIIFGMLALVKKKIKVKMQ
ncbi:MAG TPA: MraY family glycosyltransferase [Patescibacteria group bacterium]|nr:MraY family glycosyltransferase [Patescibacteria group bacterium]